MSCSIGLESARINGVITAEQVKMLQNVFEKELPKVGPGRLATFWHSFRSNLSFMNALYFAGGIIIILAMTLFMGVGLLVHPFVLSLIAFVYFCFFYIGGAYAFSISQNWEVLGGVLGTVAVAMSPLFTYGMLEGMGLWKSPPYDYFNYIDERFIFLETAVFLTSLFVVWKIPFGFLLMPAAFSAWMLTMDIVPLIFGSSSVRGVLYIKNFCFLVKFLSLCSSIA